MKLATGRRTAHDTRPPYHEERQPSNLRTFILGLLLLLAPGFFFAEPSFAFEASDGVFEDRVEITWPALEDPGTTRLTLERNGIAIAVLAGSETFFADTTGEPGIDYEYCLTSSDFGVISLGCDLGSRLIFAPTDLIASDALFEDGILLSWADRSEREAEYWLTRSQDQSNFTLVATLPANAISFKDTTAEVGVAYQYCLAALDADGFSSAVTCDFGLRAEVTPPARVLASDGQSTQFVQISWTDQSAAEDGFVLYRDGALIATTAADVTTFADSTADLLVDHTYCVASTVNGVESVQLCDEGRRGGLAPPQDVQASDDQFDDRVALTWRDQAPSEDGFEVLRTAAGQNNFVLIATLEANATAYDDFSAGQGVDYTYCVRAFSNADTAEVSESELVCDEGCRSSVLAPVGLRATDGAFEDRVELSWSNPSTTAMLFNIYRDGVLIQTLPVSQTTYEDRQIESGIEYEYTVASETVILDTPAPSQQLLRQVETLLLEARRQGALPPAAPADQQQLAKAAVSAAARQLFQLQVGAVVESAPAEARGRRLINPPTSLEATYDEHEDRVELTWEDPSQVSRGHRIYRSDSDDPSESHIIAEIDAGRLSYSDYEGEPRKEYIYRVSTFDSYGESALAEAVGFRQLAPPTALQASDGDFETRITLTWEDNSRAETAYAVFRDNDFVDLLPANTTTFADSNGIEYGRAYQYSVVAEDGFGFAETVTDSGATAIRPPVDLNASKEHSDIVSIVWSDVSAIEDGYRLTRRLLTGDTIDIDLVLPPDATSYTDPIDSAQQGAQFLYCVTAFSADMASAEVCTEGGTPAPGRQVDNTEMPRKVPSIAGSNGHFGTAVAIDGENGLIGSPSTPFLPNDNFDRVGKTRHYIRDVEGNWIFNGDIDPDFFGSGFFYGAALDINGDRAIVGGPGNGDNGVVYFFRRDNGVWTERRSEAGNRNDFESSDLTGTSVALSDDFAIFGAPAHDTNLPGGFEFDGGGAFVLAFDESTLETNSVTELHQLSGVDLSREDQFGTAVALSGNRALVGAPFDDDGRGDAYLFEHDGNNWALVAKSMLPFSQRQPGSDFGTAVALSGDWALVGAPSTDNRGTVYVFKRDPVQGWLLQTEQLLPIEVDRQDGAQFGAALSFLGNYALVGAPGQDRGQGAAYFFELDPASGQWTRPVKLTAAGLDPAGGTASLGGTDRFGQAVAIGQGYYLIGAPGDDDAGVDAGAFYSVPFFFVPPDPTSQPLAPPSQVQASDDRDQSIQVKWRDNADDEEGYRIYRSNAEGDLEQIASLPANTEVFNDVEAVPATAYEYRVAAFLGEFSESARSGDFGWRPANGSLSGRVAAQRGGGTADVAVCLDPSPNRGLLFDSRGRVVVEDFPPPPDAFTIEFWARDANQNPGQQRSVLLIGPSPIEGLTKSIWIILGDGLIISVGDGGLSSPELLDAQWHHWAVTYQRGNAIAIYQDGALKSELLLNEDYDLGGGLLLGNIPDSEPGLEGNLDELRIWNYLRSPDQIAQEKNRALTGNEPGLLGYWPLDQGEQRVAADLSPAAQHGVLQGGAYWASQGAPLDICATTDVEGNYTLGNLRYGEGTTFKVTPALGTRSFNPAFKTITLNGENPVQNEVDFTDNSAFTVSGVVRFADTQCPVPDAEILVDGVVKGRTESDGTYAVAVDPSVDDNDLRLIELRLVDSEDASDFHQFVPPETRLLVKEDVPEVDFTDTKTRTFSGYFGGSCNIPIGTATLKITTENGCFERLVPVEGNFSLELPPQAYLVQALDVQPSIGELAADIITFFDDFGVKQIDLTDEAGGQDFLYRAPLQILVEGLPEPLSQCGALTTADGRQLPSVPVLSEGAGLSLSIDLAENYGPDNRCLVDSGQVTIIDAIGDRAEAPTVLPVAQGRVEYQSVVGEPDIFTGRRVDGVDRSLQKSLVVVAEVPGRQPVSQTEWVIVEGIRERTATFVSATTDEFPLLILHDPPGGGSYAYIEEGSTFCTTVSNTRVTDIAGGAEVDLNFGFKVTAGPSFGAAYLVETGGGVSIGLRTEIGHEVTTLRGGRPNFQICATATERFSTSSDVTWVGEDAFVGVALNLIFALADVLEVDRAQCSTSLSETLATDLDQANPFETTFVFGQSHISLSLIPALEELVAIDEDLAIEGDLKGQTQRIRLQQAIENWQLQLARNDSLKAVGLENPVENRSFSAGADYEYSTNLDTTFVLEQRTSRLYWDKSGRAGGLLNLFGFEQNLYLTAKFNHAWISHDERTQQKSRTVGYVLSDGDTGDFFSVDVGTDPMYRTPVFAVKSGRSSNPWEDGTQQRDRPLVSVDPPILTGIDPGEIATFTLSMTNGSESQERREYVLAVPGETNPGNAGVIATGDLLGGARQETFLFEPKQTLSINLGVMRGPDAYTYDSLAVILYPELERQIWLADPRQPFALADTAWFSVHFNAPCSDIAILRPREHWTLNGASIGDSLEVILHQFDLAPTEDDQVTQLGLEYRLQGTSTWQPAVLTNPGQLAAATTSWLAKWRPLQDGVYEVRAYTECEVGGRVHTPPLPGSVDTKAPQVLGTPQPADQMLVLGGDIGLHFDEAIDCASVVTQGSNANVALTFLDGPNAGSAVANLASVCDGRRLTLAPPTDFDWSQAENWRLQASLQGLAAGAITDLAGNPLAADFAWDFTVRRTDLAWRPANHSPSVFVGQPHSLTATLVNGRGQAADFTLADVPDWLTPSQNGATLPPGGETQIHFTLSDTLPLGAHQATLSAQTAGGAVLLYIDVEVTEDDRPQQSIALGAGWQWFSLNRDPVNGAIDHALASLSATEGDLVKSQTAFSIYDPGSGGWVGSLAAVDPGQTYLIHSAQAHHLVVPGTAVDPANRPLAVNSGWNWLGYLPQGPLPVTDALASLAASDNDQIKSQAEFAVYDFNNRQWVGSLQTLNPGQGYMLFSAAAGTLTYPSGPPPAAKVVAADPAPRSWGLDPTGYAHSMSLVAQLPAEGLTDGTIPVEIQAFVGDQLRGTARLQYVESRRAHLAFLMVYSNQPNGETLSFRSDSGAPLGVLARPEPLVFAADTRLGTIGQPLAFGPRTAATTVPRQFALSDNYPNPFNPTTTIHYDLPEDAHVTLTLYDLLGRTVAVLLDERQEAGRFNFIIDAGHLASGVYFYRLEAADFSRVRKMVLLK